MSTTCLSRELLADRKILHTAEVSLKTSALLPGKVIPCFHEILTLQRNLHTSIEDEVHNISKTFLSNDKNLIYYTGQATEFHLSGC
jgi:hypothetical protein